VRKVWDGRANLGELEVSNPTTHLEGLSLRVYSPESHQWSIYWANSNDGQLGPAMIGQFRNGRDWCHHRTSSRILADWDRTRKPPSDQRSPS
jgi:hypothetical protein